MFYAQSTNGFYDPEINTVIPADAVEITSEEHMDLINGQSNGKIITADANGLPILVDPAAPTNEELIAAINAKRHQLLSETDWVVVRAAEQPSAIPTNYATYRAALRNITTQPGYPTTVVWPVLGA